MSSLAVAMGVTIYFPSKSGESEKLYLAHGVKITAAGGDSRLIIVHDAAGRFAGMFAADNILGAVLDPPQRVVEPAILAAWADHHRSAPARPMRMGRCAILRSSGCRMSMRPRMIKGAGS